MKLSKDEFSFKKLLPGYIFTNYRYFTEQENDHKRKYQANQGS